MVPQVSRPLRAQGSFWLGGSAALGLAQQSVVAAKLWRMRGGAGQNISIELAQAIRRLAPATERKWELLNGYPVYTFKPDQLQFAGVGYEPGTITILTNGIRVQIVEK